MTGQVAVTGGGAQSRPTYITELRCTIMQYISTFIRRDTLI